MSLVSKSEIKQLIRHHDGPCVSIFMPTNRVGPEVLQNPIRLKNLLNEIEKELRERDFDTHSIDEFLKPAQELVLENSYWQHQSDGLAIFLSNDIFLPYRLPLEFEQFHLVSDQFYLKPILPLLSGDGSFYILALSQKDVRLLLATHYSVGQVDLHDVPQSLAEALNFEDPEVISRWHPTSKTGMVIGQRAVFHGQGSDTMEEHKDHILRYFEKLDDGLREVIGEDGAGGRTDGVPMVLAGVDYLMPIYREASEYDKLVDQEVVGNPENMRPEELHQKAWEIMQPRLERAREEAANQYREFFGRDEGLASADIGEIVRAAFFGRVDTIFVPLKLHRWGKMNPDSYEVYLHDERQPGDEDLLEFAAAHTFLNDGTVYAVQPDLVPGGGPLAATFRYAQEAVRPGQGNAQRENAV